MQKVILFLGANGQGFPVVLESNYEINTAQKSSKVIAAIKAQAPKGTMAAQVCVEQPNGQRAKGGIIIPMEGYSLLSCNSLAQCGPAATTVEMMHQNGFRKAVVHQGLKECMYV